jgi:hypothetical protein
VFHNSNDKVSYVSSISVFRPPIGGKTHTLLGLLVNLVLKQDFVLEPITDNQLDKSQQNIHATMLLFGLLLFNDAVSTVYVTYLKTNGKITRNG